MNEARKTDRTRITLPSGYTATRGQLVGGAVIRAERARIRREVAARSEEVPAIKETGIWACIKRLAAVRFGKK